MTAFATVEDLEARLGRTLTDAAQAEKFLDDATAYLRGIVGHVAPQKTSTVTLHVPFGETRIELPDRPIISIGSVSAGGSAVTDYQLFDHGLTRVYGWHTGSAATRAVVTVTYTHGYATVPDDLKALCCVLAAGMLANTDDLGTPHSGNVTGMGVDDYRKSWSVESGPLPKHIVETLRAQYGQSAYVTGARA